MGSLERSKRKIQVWKKAIVQFSLCFAVGFFTGFAPIGKSSILSDYKTAPSSSIKSQFSPQPSETLHQTPKISVNRSLTVQAQAPAPSKLNEPELRAKKLSENEDEGDNGVTIVRRLIIIVTPTSSKDRYNEVLLRRLADTLRLVPPPLLWIVVEKQSDSNNLSWMLRKTGIMYRHLVFKESFTSSEDELNHQRNVALRHIEHHRLSGIVHFAGLNNVYDLDFFREIRDIEVFGTWPMAMLSANRQKLIIEGPVCDSSQVIGWHLRKINNEKEETKPQIHISSFAFNSSILWDPERWGRLSSAEGTRQDSIEYVKQVVLEDDAKLKGIPQQDCSKVMLWHLNFPTRSAIRV